MIRQVVRTKRDDSRAAHLFINIFTLGCPSQTVAKTNAACALHCAWMEGSAASKYFIKYICPESFTKSACDCTSCKQLRNSRNILVSGFAPTGPAELKDHIQTLLTKDLKQNQTTTSCYLARLVQRKNLAPNEDQRGS